MLAMLWCGVNIAYSIRKSHERIRSVATAGFVVGFYIKYASPDFLWQNYPPEWTRIYSAEGLHLKDPTLIWAMQNRGAIRWSALQGKDPGSLMERASQHGLAYGATISMESEGGLILAGYARPDREFHEGELERLHEELRELDLLVGVNGHVRSDARHEMELIMT
jgi:LuxR family transcriptional regulator, quorum-sensing system regulator SdiA